MEHNLHGAMLFLQDMLGGRGATGLLSEIVSFIQPASRFGVAFGDMPPLTQVR